MRFVLSLTVLIALTASARAGGDVGVIVTGDGSLQPQLAAQIEGWLSQHGHTLIPSPLPPDGITALIDCFVTDDQRCARVVVEKQARSSAIVYARVDAHSTATGARDVTLTAYLFEKGHDAVAERKACEHCSDQSLRSTADDIMKKLIGGADVGHVKLKSAPPGARITIDGQAIGVTPLDWDLLPGPHTIRMTDKAGASGSRDVVVQSNRTALVVLELKQPVVDNADSRFAQLWPIGALAAGGAMIVTGGVLIAINQDKTGPNPPSVLATRTPGIELALGGAVVAGVGAYFLWFRHPGAASTPTVGFTGDSGYIGWLGRF